MRMKERQEALDNEIVAINRRNFEFMKEECRNDIQRKGQRMDFLGRLHRERLEALEEEDILRAEEARKIFPKQIVQTQRLAEGVLKLKSKFWWGDERELSISVLFIPTDDEIWEQKQRQVLRASNIELKVLEARLKSTYAAKAAQVQLRESQSRRDEEKRFEKDTSALRNRWYNNQVFYRNQESEELEKKIKYRNDIQDQLISNEISRRKQTEDDHRERKIVEEVSEVLHQENVRLAEEKRDRIAHVRAERDAFFRAKEIWKCKEKEALSDEFDRQAKIIADKMIEERNQTLRNFGVSRARDSMVENNARRMLNDEVKRAEKEDVINELIAEEKNEEIAREMKQEIMKKEIVKKELLEDMTRQKEIIARNKKNEAEIDQAFGKYLAEQYDKALMEDNERLEERRRKGTRCWRSMIEYCASFFFLWSGVQYGKDLRAVVQEHRAKYAEEVMVRQEVQRRDEEQELQRLEEVALERSNMLNEHAPHLKGFLRAEWL